MRNLFLFWSFHFFFCSFRLMLSIFSLPCLFRGCFIFVFFLGFHQFNFHFCPVPLFYAFVQINFLFFFLYRFICSFGVQILTIADQKSACINIFLMFIYNRLNIGSFFFIFTFFFFFIFIFIFIVIHLFFSKFSFFSLPFSYPLFFNFSSKNDPFYFFLLIIVFFLFVQEILLNLSFLFSKLQNFIFQFLCCCLNLLKFRVLTFFLKLVKFILEIRNIFLNTLDLIFNLSQLHLLSFLDIFQILNCCSQFINFFIVVPSFTSLRRLLLKSFQFSNQVVQLVFLAFVQILGGDPNLKFINNAIEFSISHVFIIFIG